MKENLTEIIAVIDKSGSMESLAEETISGYNTFIDDQKKLSGEAILTTILFNHNYEVIANFVNIKDAKKLTEDSYKASGTTALLDAMGRAIDSTGERLAHTNESERPSKVVFLIITDGQENASKEYTKNQITDKIKHQREKYSWEFIFLAKDIETVEYAKDIGIINSMEYLCSEIGTINLYQGISNQLKNIRSGLDVDLDELSEDLNKNA